MYVACLYTSSSQARNKEMKDVAVVVCMKYQVQLDYVFIECRQREGVAQVVLFLFHVDLIL